MKLQHQASTRSGREKWQRITNMNNSKSQTLVRLCGPQQYPYYHTNQYKTPLILQCLISENIDQKTVEIMYFPQNWELFYIFHKFLVPGTPENFSRSSREILGCIFARNFRQFLRHSAFTCFFDGSWGPDRDPWGSLESILRNSCFS